MDATVTEPIEAPAREWTTPRVECVQTRPEVTAYAGDDGRWNIR